MVHFFLHIILILKQLYILKPVSGLTWAHIFQPINNKIELELDTLGFNPTLKTHKSKCDFVKPTEDPISQQIKSL